MSAFMPEREQRDPQQSGQQRWPPPKGPEEFLTNDERAFLRRYFGHPEDLPPEFRAWLVDFIAVNVPQIPISQIVGFSQFKASLSQVAASQSTTSTSYTDLTTVGPQISGLSKGQYVFLYGAFMGLSAETSTCGMSISVNGAAASDNDGCFFRRTSGDVDAHCAFAALKTVELNNNTVTAKYRLVSGSGSAGFEKRWLLALRVGN